MGRKRVNLSLDKGTYDVLMQVVRRYHFATPCELVTALVQLFIKQQQPNDDLPPDDAQYIDEMFEELSYHEPLPRSTLPRVRKPHRSID